MVLSMCDIAEVQVVDVSHACNNALYQQCTVFSSAPMCHAHTSSHSESCHAAEQRARRMQALGIKPKSSSQAAAKQLSEQERRALLQRHHSRDSGEDGAAADEHGAGLGFQGCASSALRTFAALESVMLIPIMRACLCSKSNLGCTESGVARRCIVPARVGWFKHFLCACLC